MTKPQLLLLDAQGVIFNRPLPDFLDLLAAKTGQDPDKVRSRWFVAIRERFWTGQIGEREMWSKLAPGTDPSQWAPELEEMYVPGPAFEHLHLWASELPIWILSNHRSAWLKARLKRFGIRPLFGRMYVSDVEGVAKPEASAFAGPIRAVSSADRVLFVDDRIQNVEAADALGIQTVHATEDANWIAEINQRIGVAELKAGVAG